MSPELERMFDSFNGCPDAELSGRVLQYILHELKPAVEAEIKKAYERGRKKQL